jgi:hypothetical protein
MSRSYILVLFACFLALLQGTEARPSIHSRRHPGSNNKWIPTWGSMPQLTEPANLPPAPYVSFTVDIYLCNI